MEQVNEYIEAMKAILLEMWDVLRVFGGVFELVGGLATFLGPFGFSLLLLSLVALGFVGAISPLSKFTNYLLVVVSMSALALYSGIAPAALGRFVGVMMAPLLAVHGLKLLGRWMRGKMFKGRREGRVQRVEDLIAELQLELAHLR